MAATKPTRVTRQEGSYQELANGNQLAQSIVEFLNIDVCIGKQATRSSSAVTKSILLYFEVSE